MSKSDVTEAFKAMHLWAEHCKTWEKFELSNQPQMYAFATFMGCPYDGLRNEILPTKDKEFMRKVDLINGPDGVTILKMMEIKYLEKKNGN